MPILEIIDVVTFIGLTAGAIGGPVASWCAHHKGYSGCAKKRDVTDTANIANAIIWERADVGPCNVPKYNFDQCHDQITGQAAKVMSSIPSAGVAEFNNVPPACMDLVVVLSGSCNGDGPRPTPCGSACVKYTGLSDDQFATLSKAFSK